MIRRAKSLAIAILGVTFVTGGLAGMAVEEALGLDWFDYLDPAPFEIRLLRDLDVSDSQSARADDILNDRDSRLEAYWAERVPEMQAIISESHDEIRAMLTPDQRAAFDRAVAAQGVQIPERD